MARNTADKWKSKGISKVATILKYWPEAFTKHTDFSKFKKTKVTQ